MTVKNRGNIDLKKIIITKTVMHTWNLSLKSEKKGDKIHCTYFYLQFEMTDKKLWRKLPQLENWKNSSMSQSSRK